MLGLRQAELAEPTAELPERLAGQPREVTRNGQDHVLETIELKQTKVVDAARLIAELSGLNIVVTREAGEKVITLYLQRVNVIDAIESLAKIGRLWYRVDTETGTIRIMTTQQYQNDLVVHRDDITKVFTLLHPNVVSVAKAIQDLYGPRVILSLQTLDDDQMLTGGGFGSGGGPPGLAPGFGAATSAGGGRFSRPVTGGGPHGFGYGPRRPMPHGRPVEEVLPGKPLSPVQISELEKRLDAGEGGGPRGVTVGTLRGLTHQQQPIFVTINRPHNLVIVRTSDAKEMRSIERLVCEIDRATPEVLLEMKILELTLDDNFRSIFDIQFNQGDLQGDPVAEQIARNPFLISPSTAMKGVLGLGNEAIGAARFSTSFSTTTFERESSCSRNTGA